MIGSSIPSGKVVVWEIQLQQNYDNFYGWMKQYSHESLVFAEKNLLSWHLEAMKLFLKRQLQPCDKREKGYFFAKGLFIVCSFEELSF